VVRNRILQETRPGSIVLSHDIHPGTIEAMPSTFDALKAKGFKFVTVSELIRAAAVEPSATPATSPSARAAIPLSPSPSPASSPGS
jgi:peptidoglycan-N-acetylglucosamine deacetylase